MRPALGAQGAAAVVAVAGVASVGLEQQTLSEIAKQASGCSLCRLSHGRRHVVFGEGNPDADVMFVGEAPGYHEDSAGSPFVGAAGEVFDSLLQSIGMTRESIYVTSVVKCRPQRNRTPFPDEVEACEGYLFRQVGIVSPRVICALGNVAIRVLTGRPFALSKEHGIPRSGMFQGKEATIYPLYHPAAAMYADSLLKVLRSEFKAIPGLLRDGMISQDALPPAEPFANVASLLDPEDEGESQLSMDM